VYSRFEVVRAKYVMLVAIIYGTKLIKTKLIFKLELREVSYKQMTC